MPHAPAGQLARSSGSLLRHSIEWAFRNPVVICPLRETQEASVLDVHPPHAAVHGWRDFLIHIATITLGLLIALLLEGALTAIDHRHLVREARENIHAEIQANAAEAKDDVRFLQEDADRMKSNARLAHAYLTNPHALSGKNLSFTFTWNSLNESAWRSARDSGALTYMPLAEVQRYADIYAQQDIIDREAVDVFTSQPEMAAGLLFLDEPGSAGELSQEETKTLLAGTERTYYRLLTLKELLMEQNDMMAKELKH